MTTIIIIRMTTPGRTKPMVPYDSVTKSIKNNVKKKYSIRFTRRCFSSSAMFFFK